MKKRSPKSSKKKRRQAMPRLRLEILLVDQDCRKESDSFQTVEALKLVSLRPRNRVLIWNQEKEMRASINKKGVKPESPNPI